eukprot:gene52678-70423_t
MVAFAGALIGAGIGWRFGRQWIQNMWLRVALFALVAGALAFTFGPAGPDAGLTMHTGTPDPLAPWLSGANPLVLDGALATELEKRGADLRDPLWSARLLIEQPELIRQ